MKNSLLMFFAKVQVAKDADHDLAESPLADSHEITLARTLSRRHLVDATEHIGRTPVHLWKVPALWKSALGAEARKAELAEAVLEGGGSREKLSFDEGGLDALLTPG